MVRLVAFLVAILAACGRLGFDEIPEPGPFRKRITVAPFPAALPKFPLSLDTSDPELIDRVRVDGADLVVTTDDGVTRLPTELVFVNDMTGTLDLWFVVPELPTAEPIDLFLYYGGDPIERTSPWDDRFAGVWHMDRRNGLVLDSARGNDARQPNDALVPGFDRGVAGAAAEFDGVDDTLAVSDPADGSLDFGMRSFSFSMWVNVTASSGEFDIPLHKGGSDATTSGYDYELGTTRWAAHVADSSDNLASLVGDELDFLGRWVQLFAVVDRAAGELRSYADGVQGEATDISTLGSVDTSEELQLGRRNAVFKGLLDEVRVYTTAVPVAYMNAERAMLSDRSLITLGPEEQR